VPRGPLPLGIDLLNPGGCSQRTGYWRLVKRDTKLAAKSKAIKMTMPQPGLSPLI